MHSTCVVIRFSKNAAKKTEFLPTLNDYHIIIVCQRKFRDNFHLKMARILKSRQFFFIFESSRNYKLLQVRIILLFRSSRVAIIPKRRAFFQPNNRLKQFQEAIIYCEFLNMWNYMRRTIWLTLLSFGFTGPIASVRILSVS